MSMRLHEVHPSLVHFPITLFPVALGADVAGLVGDDDRLMEIGRLGMIGAAISTAIAGVFGFIAQEEIVSGDAHDILVTHRTMNVAFLGLATVMAASRARRRSPSWSYLTAGLIGAGSLFYSAYLGGKMVYSHGVGVERAGGVDRAQAPQLRPSQAGRVAVTAAKHAALGVGHTMQDMAAGDIAPALIPRRR